MRLGTRVPLDRVSRGCRFFEIQGAVLETAHICVQGSEQELRRYTNLVNRSQHEEIAIVGRWVWERTGLVLAYSLSMKPWSHVLTLYLRTSFMASSSPFSPRPSPFGRHKANSLTKSSGLQALTRAFWTTPCLFGSSSPTALDGTASSASRMKGMIRDLTASISYCRQP